MGLQVIPAPIAHAIVGDQTISNPAWAIWLQTIGGRDLYIGDASQLVKDVATANGIVKAVAGHIISASPGTDFENPLTFSGPLLRSTNVISIQKSDAAHDGYLTQTDWATFNGKLSSLTGALLATGSVPGATSEAQEFTLGIETGSIQPLTDGVTALQIFKADGTTNILTVDSTNGRIGVNTTTPGATLELGSGSILLANNAGLLQKDSGGTARIVFKVDPSNNAIFGGAGLTGQIQFFNNGAQNLTIDASGNTSVGTATPISGAKLTVSGLIGFGGTNSTGAGTPLLGTNCPAGTLTAPYTWLSAKSADGSTVFIPCWK